MIYAENKNEGCKTSSKNQLGKGIFFIYKGPWEPNHSCLHDQRETVGVEQDEISSDNEDYFIVGAIDLLEITHEEYQSSIYGDQQCDVIKRDLQDNMIIINHHNKHIEVHG